VRKSYIKSIKAGLWYRDTNLSIIDRQTGKWGFMVKENNNGKIKGLSLNTLLKDFTQVDLLKLDIEGAEKEVFLYNTSWLDKVETIIIELHSRINPGASEIFFSTIRSKWGKCVKYRNRENVIMSKKFELINKNE